jgi:hypothetical protein
VDIRRIATGDRRLEGETYLSAGFNLREAITTKTGGWVYMSDIAHVVQPNRLKGLLVSPKHGLPFLAATQVFDVKPTPRKFLARSQELLRDYTVDEGTILVTRSGSVGRAIQAYAPHRDTIISDDLLRVLPKNPALVGWIYAVLLSRSVREMATGVQYGHIIKHLEVAHLQELPIPLVDDGIAAGLSGRVSEVLALRNAAYDATKSAESIYAEAIGVVTTPGNEEGFAIDSSQLTGRRRRLEASYYTPYTQAVLNRLPSPQRLKELSLGVWWMTRFKRFYGDGGIPYLAADELFTTNPEPKKILVDPSDRHEAYFVERDWIVMACSGQTYGLNGAAALMTPASEGVFFSHDLIRIRPNKKLIRPGYLLMTLTHPTLGRPLLIRAAYGTSIPHLEPSDVAEFLVARLDDEIESQIADLMESAAQSRSLADQLERSIAAEADRIVRNLVGLPS